MEKLGASLRKFLGDEEIAVGGDVRFSTGIIKYHLMEGLGGEIKDIGITTTPMAYFHSWERGMETVQITASHNPPEYNGLKFSHPNGMDWDVKELHSLKESYREAVPYRNPRVEYDNEWKKAYFTNYEEWEVKNIDLGLDPSNGAGYLLIPLLKLKFKLKVVNGVPDGRFPVHPPNPLDKRSEENLKKLNTTWGLLLDGDADRGVFFYKGRKLGNDEVVAFLAERGLIGDKVAIEITMPLKLEQYLKDLGMKVIRTPTGRVLIKQMAQKEKFDFFAEYSGHFGFREFNYIDDPLQVLFRIVNEEFDTEYKPPLVGMMNLYLSRQDISAILNRFKPEEMEMLDGFDARNEMGRLVLRESKTESGVWRISWEAEDRETFKKIEGMIRRG